MILLQMITLGGDAELELVDSLDPFSEGVVFSVRPPKKSWKNIANLSGGEKVLLCKKLMLPILLAFSSSCLRSHLLISMKYCLVYLCYCYCYWFQTLSSLALVFALHHYKPTPLYVMDEIDAALGMFTIN